jgi:hypothetical protein
MLIEWIILLVKLLAGKGVVGSVSGATAGTAANVVVKSTIFAKAGLAGEIGSNVVGIGVGEVVGNSVEKYRKRHMPYVSSWLKPQIEYEERLKRQNEEFRKRWKIQQKESKERLKRQNEEFRKRWKIQQKESKERLKRQNEEFRKVSKMI